MKFTMDFSQLNPKKLVEDFETCGWTRITVDQEFTQKYKNFLQLTEKFFSMTEEKKRALVNPHGIVIPGYLPYPGGKDGYFHDSTQMYHKGLHQRDQEHESGIRSFMRYANQRSELRDFEESIYQLCLFNQNLSLKILELIENYFKIPRGDFTRLVDGGWSIQRAMIYPKIESRERVNSLTVGEHRDTSVFTITLGGSQSGLENKNFQGEWEEIKDDSRSLIIGVGGMLQQLTNGNFKNMFHRVRILDSHLSTSRISTPFFCWPRPEAILEPHPIIMKKFCQNQRYPRQLAIRHLEQNLSVPFSHAEDKQLIDEYMGGYDIKRAA